jgi:putative tricarboxylic transport membrane protein
MKCGDHFSGPRYMNANRGDRIASVVAAAFSLAYLVTAFFIPLPPLKQQLGPAALPKAIGLIMVILSGLYVNQQFRGRAKEDEDRAAIIGAEEKVESKADLKTMGFILAMMLVYAFFFERLGYAISTFLAFMAGVLYLNRRRLFRDTVIAVILSFALYYVFMDILRVNLPAGPLKLLGL